MDCTNWSIQRALRRDGVGSVPPGEPQMSLRSEATWRWDLGMAQEGCPAIIVEEDCSWALRHLRSLYQGSLPSVVLTDRCFGAMNAVASSFSFSKALNAGVQIAEVAATEGVTPEHVKGVIPAFPARIGASHEKGDGAPRSSRRPINGISA